MMYYYSNRYIRNAQYVCLDYLNTLWPNPGIFWDNEAPIPQGGTLAWIVSRYFVLTLECFETKKGIGHLLPRIVRLFELVFLDCLKTLWPNLGIFWDEPVTPSDLLWGKKANSPPHQPGTFAWIISWHFHLTLEYFETTRHLFPRVVRLLELSRGILA